MNRYIKKENEDDISYGLRLVEILKTERPDDLEWEDIKNFIGFEGNKDSLRKANDTILGGFSVHKYYQQKIKEILENKNNDTYMEDKIDELENKIRDLDIARKKLQIINIEYNRNNREKSRRELYYENIGKAIEQIPLPNLLPLQIQKENEEYVMVFSDIHYNSTFEAISNSYSREICKQRFELLLCELKEFIEENNVSKLKIVNGGDSLQGMLRINDLKLNDLSVIDSLVEFQKLMASFLNELSKYCNIEYYHVNSANHTELRLLGTKAKEMSVEDMEKIIVNYLKDVLVNNPRIFINTEFKQDTIQFKILDYNIVALHGHQLNNIKTAIKDLSDKYDTPFDFCILGHYHQGLEMSVGERKGYAKEVLVCSSFVGTCPYADSLMVGGKASVKIHKFISNKGRRTTETIVLN